jgi:preprotein translocase subunit Sec61beta
MKRNLPTFFSIAALVIAILSASGLASAEPLARILAAGGSPTLVSYQGQVTVGGSAYSGIGYFKFAVVSLDGGTSYWSNDGTSTVGNEPTAAVTLTVSNGLFNVLLGDTSLTNMTALQAAVFDNPNRALRVWFSSSGSSYDQLDPDRQIAAVPYALQAERAKDADTLDGQDGSAYQNRVDGTCPVGSSVREVASDGSVICEPQDTRPLFSLSTLDSGEDLGMYTSITIGTDGLGLISYYDDGNDDLKVAHCNDTACTSVITSTLDTDGGMGTSIAIGADGLGLISYYDYWNDDLKVAHCNNTTCTSAATTILESDVDGGWGKYTSIAIGADGLGLISYYDEYDYNGYLKVAHCNNTACTSAAIYTLDTGLMGEFSSITIGADGLGLISYYDSTNYDLKVAHCNNTACSTAVTTTLDIEGMYTSITTGDDGLGLISYYDEYNGHLKVAHCDNIACTSATIYTLDDVWDTGLYTSITIGADGLGLISYYVKNYHQVTDLFDLKVAHCNNTACSSATTYTIDIDGNVGQYTSITIGTDGMGLISYYDDTNGDLKSAHLSNVFGVPYFRRR